MTSPTPPQIFPSTAGKNHSGYAIQGAWPLRIETKISHDVAMQWAKACQHLITMLHALDDGDQTKADSEFEAAQGWVNRTKSKTVNDRNDQGEELPNSIIPITGDGSFDLFLANATAIYKGQ